MGMLHLGCGQVYLPGWINLDAESTKADVKHDLRKPLPYGEESIDFVYSEHLIEHLTAEEGEAFLKEARRVLRKGGVMRIATPDLDYVVFKYLFGWRRQPWIAEYGHSHIKTRAEMMNIVFREWGHKWIYNFGEMERRLRSSGFERVKRERFGRSRSPVLRNLETRKDSKLIVECTK